MRPAAAARAGAQSEGPTGLDPAHPPRSTRNTSSGTEGCRPPLHPRSSPRRRRGGGIAAALSESSLSFLAQKGSGGCWVFLAYAWAIRTERWPRVLFVDEKRLESQVRNPSLPTGHPLVSGPGHAMCTSLPLCPWPGRAGRGRPPARQGTEGLPWREPGARPQRSVHE